MLSKSQNLVKQKMAITSVTDNKFHLDLALLTAQEEFFWHVKQCFMYLETCYRAWDQQRARGRALGPPSLVYPMPAAVARPRLHK